MSILEELYHGNINPSELHIKKGSEYQKVSKQFAEKAEKLLVSLNKEEAALFESILDDHTSLSYISEKDRFAEGFRIGALLMWEIMNYESQNFI